MMYIAASLPPMYGAFHQIQQDNYPFSAAFTTYLESIASLGLALQMDMDETSAYLEDMLFVGERLPDIPKGDAPVKFRYRVNTPVLEEFCEGSDLTNKAVILFAIRLSLRLSVRYGTSLLRMARLIDGLLPKEDPIEIMQKQREKDHEKPIIRITKKTPAAAPAPDSIPEESPSVEEQESEVLKRLEDLTRKGDALIQGSLEDAPVVETNPLLSNFF